MSTSPEIPTFRKTYLPRGEYSHLTKQETPGKTLCGKVVPVIDRHVLLDNPETKACDCGCLRCSNLSLKLVIQE